MGNTPSRQRVGGDGLIQVQPPYQKREIEDRESSFVRSISLHCPSRDDPNAVVRITEHSGSATSHNESLLSISLEDQHQYNSYDSYDSTSVCSNSTCYSNSIRQFSLPNPQISFGRESRKRSASHGDYQAFRRRRGDSMEELDGSEDCSLGEEEEEDEEEEEEEEDNDEDEHLQIRQIAEDEEVLEVYSVRLHSMSSGEQLTDDHTSPAVASAESQDEPVDIDIFTICRAGPVCLDNPAAVDVVTAEDVPGGDDDDESAKGEVEPDDVIVWNVGRRSLSTVTKEEHLSSSQSDEAAACEKEKEEMSRQKENLSLACQKDEEGEKDELNPENGEESCDSPSETGPADDAGHVMECDVFHVNNFSMFVLDDHLIQS